MAKRDTLEAADAALRRLLTPHVGATSFSRSSILMMTADVTAVGTKLDELVAHEAATAVAAAPAAATDAPKPTSKASITIQVASVAQRLLMTFFADEDSAEASDSRSSSFASALLTSDDKLGLLVAVIKLTLSLFRLNTATARVIAASKKLHVLLSKAVLKLRNVAGLEMAHTTMANFVEANPEAAAELLIQPAGLPSLFADIQAKLIAATEPASTDAATPTDNELATLGAVRSPPLPDQDSFNVALRLSAMLERMFASLSTLDHVPTSLLALLAESSIVSCLAVQAWTLAKGSRTASTALTRVQLALTLARLTGVLHGGAEDAARGAHDRVELRLCVFKSMQDAACASKVADCARILESRCSSHAPPRAWENISSLVLCLHTFLTASSRTLAASTANSGVLELFMDVYRAMGGMVDADVAPGSFVHDILMDLLHQLRTIVTHWPAVGQRMVDLQLPARLMEVATDMSVRLQAELRRLDRPYLRKSLTTKKLQSRHTGVHFRGYLVVHMLKAFMTHVPEVNTVLQTAGASAAIAVLQDHVYTPLISRVAAAEAASADASVVANAAEVAGADASVAVPTSVSDTPADAACTAADTLEVPLAAVEVATVSSSENEPPHAIRVCEADDAVVPIARADAGVLTDAA